MTTELILVRSMLKSELLNYRDRGLQHGKYLLVRPEVIQTELDRRSEWTYDSETGRWRYDR